MEVVRADGASLHVLLAGHGEPTTLFVHGLGQSARDVRIFGSGVEGTRAFVDMRGHGASSFSSTDAEAQWSYQTLAADIDAVADELTATAALGVSAGGAALLALLADNPGRFAKVALVLPNPLAPRAKSSLDITDHLADAVAANDQVELARLLMFLQPESVRGRVEVGLWARRQASQLGGTGAAAAMRNLPHDSPLSDPTLLSRVQAEVLVLAQRGDDAHPVAAAEDLMRHLPEAELVVSEKPWIWEARHELRQQLVGFFNS